MPEGAPAPAQKGSSMKRKISMLFVSMLIAACGQSPAPESAATNYQAMTLSLKAFGELRPLAGVGEEAVAVDGGIMGAQVALRTGNGLANVAAGCGGSGPANLEQVEKMARAVAARL